MGALVQKIHVFSEDIGIQFNIEKCSMLVIEKEKIAKSVCIELPGSKVIVSLQEGGSYKYFGILEADYFLGEEMKLKISKKYFRRFRKCLKSRLSGRNLVQRVSIWAMFLFLIFSSIY